MPLLTRLSYSGGCALGRNPTPDAISLVQRRTSRSRGKAQPRSTVLSSVGRRCLCSQLPLSRCIFHSVFEAEFPFAQLELKTDGFSIFKELDSPNDKLGFLIANRSGQEIWKALAAKRIHQFDYDEEYGLALRWYPRGHDVPILVDPQISFGAPILEDTGIATWALAARVRGGELRESILSEFDYITPEGLDAALEFEGILQAA